MSEGTVSAAVESFVEGLGTLSARQAVACAQARRLAALLDGEESGSAAAAIDRELRQVMAALEPATQGVQPWVEVEDEVGPDPVATMIDEVARKRAARGL